MTDRESDLRALASECREHERVVDAFLAKSFTDRLVVVDCRGDEVPGPVRAALAGEDVRPVEAVYGDEAAPSHATGDDGNADGTVRHHFVDVRTRGQHQSYVVE